MNWSNEIRRMIDESPVKKMLGAQLAKKLRDECQYNPHQHGKLAILVSNIPDIGRVGKSGADWIYGFVGDQRSSVIELLSTSHISFGKASAIWKTFASPKGDFLLWVEVVSEKFEVVHKSKLKHQPNWVQIHSCTTEQLERQARNWAQNIENLVQRQTLIESIDMGTGPNSEFLRLLGEFELVGEWNLWRKHEILQLLAVELEAKGLKDAQIWIHRLETILNRPSKAVGENRGSHHEKSDLREFLIKTLKLLTNDELSEINLPAKYAYRLFKH